MTVHDVATPALLQDAAALARRDPAFKADMERYFIGHTPTLGRRLLLIFGFGLLGGLAKNRPVPWDGDLLLHELLRRRVEAQEAKAR